MRNVLQLSLPLVALLGLATAGAAGPALTVEAVYPGANARVVADTVAVPIEQQVNGVEGMLWMSSRSTGDGTCTLTVAFRPGTDLNITQVLVQNRVSVALPTLPEEVRRQGVTVRKASPGPLLLLSLSSPAGRYDTLFLGNLAAVQLNDELARLSGVGSISCVGRQGYDLRVWLDPEKLAARDLTAGDVVRALREQHARVEVARPPAEKGRDVPLALKTGGRLADPERIADVVVKTGPEGRFRLKDVARVELGAREPQGFALLNSKPIVMLAIHPTPGARPRELSATLRGDLRRLGARLPEGVRLDPAFDFTPNVEPGGAAKPEYLLLDPDLPAGASAEDTLEALERCDALLRGIKGVQDVLALSEGPFGASARRPCVLVRLAPAGKGRPDRGQLIAAVRERLETVPGIALRTRDLSAPGAFPRCGYPVDLAVSGPEGDRVHELARDLARRLRRSKELTDVWADPASEPRSQLSVDVDRTKAKRLGVSVEVVFSTLEVSLGPLTVGEGRGGTWRVEVRADAGPRAAAENIRKLRARNGRGELVPLGALVEVREVEAPAVVDRLDGRPVVRITANPAPGVSLARARALCEARAEEARKGLRLPAAYRLTWLREMSAPK